MCLDTEMLVNLIFIFIVTPLLFIGGVIFIAYKLIKIKPPECQ